MLLICKSRLFLFYQFQILSLILFLLNKNGSALLHSPSPSNSPTPIFHCNYTRILVKLKLNFVLLLLWNSLLCHVMVYDYHLFILPGVCVLSFALFPMCLLLSVLTFPVYPDPGRAHLGAPSAGPSPALLTCSSCSTYLINFSA